jgi:hypothetical protein
MPDGFFFFLFYYEICLRGVLINYSTAHHTTNNFFFITAIFIDFLLISSSLRAQERKSGPSVNINKNQISKYKSSRLHSLIFFWLRHIKSYFGLKSKNSS